MGSTHETGLNAEISELREGVAILELAGEIDMATAPILSAQFRTLTERGLTEIMIDATDVTFMDSMGVHALVDGKKTIHERGSHILLVASPAVRRILDLAFSGPLFAKRFDTREEAIEALLSREETVK